MPEEEKEKEKGAEEREEAKPKAAAPSRLVKYLLGSLVFLLIVAVTGAVAFAVSRFVIGKMSAGPETARVADERGILADQVPKLYDCGGEPFTVILTDPEGRGGSSTLRVFVYLSVNPAAQDPDADKILEVLRRRTPFIRDAIFEVLRMQDPRHFTGPAAAEGWGNLKAQIQKAVHDQLPTGYQIQQVLFDNPIFQAG